MRVGKRRRDPGEQILHRPATFFRGQLFNSVGRVRGVQGLRVVDASVFPEIPSTPTNLTTIMLAERIAASIVAGYPAGA